MFEYLVRLTDVVVLEALSAGGRLSAVVETLIAAVRDILVRVLSDAQVRPALGTRSRGGRSGGPAASAHETAPQSLRAGGRAMCEYRPALPE